MFTLSFPDRAIGKGQGAHRHGWAEVVAAMKEVEGGPLILDDFMDYTFDSKTKSKRRYNRAYKKPWVGILHHPPTVPEWYKRGGLGFLDIVKLPLFQESAPHLKCIIVLSEYLRDAIKDHVAAPVVAIKHPFGESVTKFQPQKFIAASPRNVMQIGWYMKNTMAIHQLYPVATFRKVHVKPQELWIERAHKLCREHYRNRLKRGQTYVTGYMQASEYDQTVCTSVGFMELIDASANNTILDYMGRKAPLILNRHPAAEEYLGADYPLFYDEFEHAHELLDVDLCLRAHRYLKAMDMSDLSLDFFVSRLLATIRDYA